MKECIARLKSAKHIYQDAKRDYQILKDQYITLNPDNKHQILLRKRERDKL